MGEARLLLGESTVLENCSVCVSADTECGTSAGSKGEAERGGITRDGWLQGGREGGAEVGTERVGVHTERGWGGLCHTHQPLTCLQKQLTCASARVCTCTLPCSPLAEHCVLKRDLVQPPGFRVGLNPGRDEAPPAVAPPATLTSWRLACLRRTQTRFLELVFSRQSQRSTSLLNGTSCSF